MFKGLTKKAITDAKEVIASDISKHLPTILTVTGTVLGLLGCGLIFSKPKPREITVIYNYYITYKGDK